MSGKLKPAEPDWEAIAKAEQMAREERVDSACRLVAVEAHRVAVAAARYASALESPDGDPDDEIGVVASKVYDAIRSFKAAEKFRDAVLEE